MGLEGDVLLIDSEFCAPHVEYRTASNGVLNSPRRMSPHVDVGGKFRVSPSIFPSSDDYPPSSEKQLHPGHAYRSTFSEERSDLEIPDLSDLEIFGDPASSSPRGPRRMSLPLNLLPTTPSSDMPGPWHTRAESPQQDVAYSLSSLAGLEEEPANVVRRVHSSNDAGPEQTVPSGAKDPPLEPSQERPHRVMRKFPSMPASYGEEAVAHIDVAPFRSPKPPPQRIITGGSAEEPLPSRRSSLELDSPSSVIPTSGCSPVCSPPTPGAHLMGAAPMMIQSPRVRADGASAMARSRARAPEGLSEEDLQRSRVTVEALVEAVRVGDLDLISSLLQECPSKKALVQEIHPVSKLTALHEAVLSEDEAAVQLLLNAGADPNGAPCPQGPPLIAAVQRGREKLMKMLLTSGANINATDEEHFNTALHHACMLGNRSVVKVLLFTGASTSAINKEGKTPFQLARDNSIAKLVTNKYRDRSGSPPIECLDNHVSPYPSPPISPSGAVEPSDFNVVESPRGSHRGGHEASDREVFCSYSSNSSIDTVVEIAEESFLDNAVAMLKAEGVADEDLAEYTRDPDSRPHLVVPQPDTSHNDSFGSNNSFDWGLESQEDDRNVPVERRLSPNIRGSAEVLGLVEMSGGHEPEDDRHWEEDGRGGEGFVWHQVGGVKVQQQESMSDGEDGQGGEDNWRGFGGFRDVRGGSGYGGRRGPPEENSDFDRGERGVHPSPPREPNHDSQWLGGSSPSRRPGFMSPRGGPGEGRPQGQSSGGRSSKQLFGDGWKSSGGSERISDLGPLSRSASAGGASAGQGGVPRPLSRTRSTSISAVELSTQEPPFLQPDRRGLVRQPSMESLVLRAEASEDIRGSPERPSPGRGMADRGGRMAGGVASGADRWGMHLPAPGVAKPARPSGTASGPSRGGQDRHGGGGWRDDADVDRDRLPRNSGLVRSVSSNVALPKVGHDRELDSGVPPTASKWDRVQQSSPRLRLTRPAADGRADRQNWVGGGLVPSRPVERGTANVALSPRLTSKNSRMTEQGGVYQSRTITPPPLPSPLELEHPPSRPKTPPPPVLPPLTSAIRRGTAAPLRSESAKEKRKVKFAVPDLAVPSEAATKEDLDGIRVDWRTAAAAGGCVACGKEGCNRKCIEKPGQKKGGQDAAKDLFSNAERKATGLLKWTRGELLGEGAYGKVFAGLNQSTGELMAVKQLKLADGDDKGQHMAALEREITLYRKMRHKHIVGYIDMEKDEASGSLYVFLEFVSGGSIHSMLERFGKFSEPLVQIYTRQLLLGLEYLHGQKIIHRDIKGGNVLVDADGVIKLADFGASKAFHDATLTDGCKSIRGSVFWMAPEVIKGEGYGRRADIWSVGCTVIEMLTGTHPWPGMDNTWTAIFHIAKTTTGPPMPADCSELGKDFLTQCFQLAPADRPSASHLLQHPFVAVQDDPKEARLMASLQRA